MDAWIFYLGTILTSQFIYGYGASKPNPKELVFENGGEVTWLIIRGKQARPGQFPGAAALRTNDSKGDVGCTGTIVHKRWIITAAHCTKYVETTLTHTWVTAGDHERIPFAQARAKTKIVEVHNYPRWEENLDFDISLAKVYPEFKFDRKYVKSVPIVNYKVKIGDKCQIFGWGTTTQPKPEKSKTPEEEYKFMRYMEAEITAETKNEKFFFKDPTQQASICYGDSGAGFICNGFLVGPLSTMNGPCVPGKTEGGIAGVYKVRSWMEGVIGEKLVPEPITTTTPTALSGANDARVNLLLLLTLFVKLNVWLF